MEKRFDPRQEINSSVLVFQNTIGCINARVKNISDYGMLLETGQSTLPTGEVVELAGPASLQLESRFGLPRALIIHSKGGQAGLLVMAGNNGASQRPA